MIPRQYSLFAPTDLHNFIDWEQVDREITFYCCNKDGTHAYGYKMQGEVKCVRGGWILGEKGIWTFPEEVPFLFDPPFENWYERWSIRPGSNITVDMRLATS